MFRNQLAKSKQAKHTSDLDSEKEKEREREMLRADSLEARRKQAGKGYYIYDQHSCDLSWQCHSDGLDKLDNYLGPRYNSQDDLTKRENAFWNKNSSRPTRAVAVQSLAANEDHFNIDKSIASKLNCQFYWDKATKEMIPIDPTDTLWVARKFNGCTVHGKVIKTHGEEFNDVDPDDFDPKNWDLHLCFWDQHNFYIPIPLRVKTKWTQLGEQLQEQIETIKYEPDRAFALDDLVYVAELTTAESAEHLFHADLMGRDRLGRVNSYKTHVISRHDEPNCFADLWENDEFRQEKFQDRFGDTFEAYCTKHYAKDPQHASHFFYQVQADGTRRECELQFMLIGAFPIGEFKHSAPAPLKVFAQVNSNDKVIEKEYKDPAIVKGVKWLVFRPDQADSKESRVDRFQKVIRNWCAKLPTTEGFVMSIEENKTDIWFRRGRWCAWHRNSDATSFFMPREVAVVKLKPTSEVKGLPLRVCNQIGETNQHHSAVVMRVPWFCKSDPQERIGKERWIRVHTQTDQTKNPKFWQHWQQTWDRMLPKTNKQRWLEQHPEATSKKQDFANYGAFYFIYSSVDPNAEPEFAVPVGQRSRAGDIFDQIKQAHTSPAAGGATSNAKEEDLPPQTMPKHPKRPKRADAGSWHRDDAAGRQRSRPAEREDEEHIVISDADNVFDLYCLYPAFYLRMLSTAKAQH